jgi:hypothetical protein
MDLLWPAIIGAVGAVIAALIPSLLARQASVRNTSYDKVTGSINEPEPDATVRRTFKCSGVVTGLQTGLSIWLAVEVGDLVWPKESKVAPDLDNRWSATVFEDGASEAFAVALFVGDSKVDRFIGKWLEAGRRTGNYSELRGVPGARRLARVDGLRLN